MATIYKSDGSKVKIEPNPGPRFSLDEMQKVVGGLIELIGLDKGYMVVNEEGKIYQLPFNFEATKLAYENKAIFPGDYIAGDALVCTIDEMD